MVLIPFWCLGLEFLTLMLQRTNMFCASVLYKFIVYFVFYCVLND